MINRKKGWYWVKWANIGRYNSWCPSWWCVEEESWWAEECYQSHADVVSIGPYIPTPDEPWKCVPLEPTEAMLKNAYFYNDFEDGGTGSVEGFNLGIYTMMLETSPNPEDA